MIFRLFSRNETQDNTTDKTISTLCESVRSSTNLQDQRDALRGVKSLSKDYPVNVGNICLRVVLDNIHNDKTDSECLLYSLETLLNICSPVLYIHEEENISKVETEIIDPSTIKAAENFINEIVSNSKDLLIPLNVLTDLNYRVRYAATKLLLILSKTKREKVQSTIIEYAQGINILVDGLSDGHEMVRNEIVLLLIELTTEDNTIQKQVAFQGGFKALFDVCASDDGKSVLIEDCVILMSNLLVENNSNQIYFRETQHIKDILPLLKSQMSGKGFVDSTWNKQQIVNIQCIFDLMSDLVSTLNVRDQWKSAQDVIYDSGILAELTAFIMMNGVPSSLECNAIHVIGNIMSGNERNQNYMATLIAPTKPPKHTILVLLISMVYDRRTLDLRWAVLCFFENFLKNNNNIQSNLAIDLKNKYSKNKQEETIGVGSLLIGYISSFDCVSSWFSSMALYALIDENEECKLEMLDFKYSSGVSAKPTNLLEFTCKILLESNNFNAKIGLIIFITEWIHSCEKATNIVSLKIDFIQYMRKIITESEKTIAAQTFQSLACYLLVSLRFNLQKLNVEQNTKTSLDSIVLDQIGTRFLEKKIKSLYENEEFVHVSTTKMCTFDSEHPPTFSLLFVTNFTRLEPHVTTSLFKCTPMSVNSSFQPYESFSKPEKEYRAEIALLKNKIQNESKQESQDEIENLKCQLDLKNNEIKKLTCRTFDSNISQDVDKMQDILSQKCAEIDCLKSHIASINSERDDLLILLADQSDTIDQLTEQVEKFKS